MNCILCSGAAHEFFYDMQEGHSYLHCPQCDLRFLKPESRLNPQDELARYSLHENDVDDPRYQDFVSPLARLIRDNVDPGAKGLDFGCGPAPVVAHMLSQVGYDMSLYDLYFYTDTSVLERTYDFICCSEVAEHFYDPALELRRLKAMLAPNGRLALMTLMYTDAVDFKSWYYRKDPTHVCFYSKKTFEFIRKEFGFKSFTQHGDRIAWFVS
jgi:hypothetical protein